MAETISSSGVESHVLHKYTHDGPKDDNNNGNSAEVESKSNTNKPFINEDPANEAADDNDDDDDDDETDPHTDGYPDLSKARAIALVSTLLGAGFLNTASIQAAVIVLPTIGEALDIPPARQQWIVSAYSLTFGCFLLLWGRLADVYGKRLIFIWGSAWVCLVTLVCPFIPNEIGFDLFRGLQGLGAAANVPCAIGLISTCFKNGKAKNVAFATYSAGAPLGGVFGNIMGGLLSQYARWEAIFWVLASISFIIAVAGQFVIPIPPVQLSEDNVKNAVDWTGGTLITVALLILLFALTQGNVVGWRTPWIIVLIILSVVLLAIFVYWQHHLEKTFATKHRRPLIKISIFRNLRISTAMLVTALFFTSFNNFLVFATYYYQDYLALSPIQTTLRFLPTGGAGVLTVIVIAHLLARIELQYILVFGMVCSILSSLLFAVPIPPDTLYWAYGFPAMCLSVFASDTLFPALMLFTALTLPREDQAMGGALVNATGQVGRAVGLAVATAVQVAVHGGPGDGGQLDVEGDAKFLDGLRAANWFSVGLSGFGLVLVVVGIRKAGKIGAVKR
ncbi:hypothetical protein MBLNU230_g3950t1 [Neophaeotheca triangularis]